MKLYWRTNRIGQTSAERSIQRTQGGDLNPQDCIKGERRTSQHRITTTQVVNALLRRRGKGAQRSNRQKSELRRQDVMGIDGNRRTRIYDSRRSELAAVFLIPGCTGRRRRTLFLGRTRIERTTSIRTNKDRQRRHKSVNQHEDREQNVHEPLHLART